MLNSLKKKINEFESEWVTTDEEKFI